MKEDHLVHLHTHCHSSAFDGLGKPHEFCEKVAEMGQPALSLTDHGTMRGLYEASLAADAAGIKLIPGAELYLVDDASKKGLTDEEKAEAKDFAETWGLDPQEELQRRSKERTDRDHVTVWAVNDVGLRNLYRLTALSWGPGFWHKPRTDIQTLCAHSEGLAVSSGCPNGVVAKMLRQKGGVNEAVSRARRLAEVFGDRFLVEIMPHVPEEDCVGLAEKLVKLADKFGATLVATQDAHYPHEEDASAQEALLCIHTRSVMSDPNRFAFDERDYWLKTRPELEKSFIDKLPGIQPRIWSKAMDATVAFADRCSAKVARPKAGAYLVAPPCPPGVADYDHWVLKLCLEGSVSRFGLPLSALGQDYKDRLRHELSTIRDLGFAKYFAAVWEVRAWARSAGILCGPGRGSGAGSLVCYLLRITDLDPIPHGLMFERFLAPGRIDLPDIDLDFESVRRGEVVRHLQEVYGEECVAHISTQNLLGGRGTANDLARIFSVPRSEIAPLTAMISEGYEEEAKTEESFARILEETDAGREFAGKYPDLAGVARRLEGQLRNVSLHAAGIVMAPVPLADIVPVETRGADSSEGEDSATGLKGRVRAVAYDMKGAEASGLVKLDILGLTTLSMLQSAFATAGRSPDEIDLEDPNVFQGFTDGRLAGIFQYDTPSARRLAAGYHFRSLADVAVMTALNRPGPAKSGLSRQFITRSVDPSKVPSVHKIYDDIMGETFGIPVYQEQVIALARGFGYSAEEADKLRKKIGKKLGLSDEEEKFVGGAVSAGMAPDAALGLWHDLTGFAAYAFNRAHSYCYGALAVWSMWLKVYHPGEFFAAAMSFKSKPEAQMRLAAEARAMGLPVRPPEVNTSGSGFQFSNGEIAGAISDLKGIGEKTAAEIAEAGPYTSLMDFYQRTAGSGRRVTKKTFEILSRASAFRSIFPHARFLAEHSDVVWGRLRAGQAPVLSAPPKDYTDDELAEVVGQVWPIAVSLSGHSAFEGNLAKIRAKMKREVFVPGDEELLSPGTRLVFAILSDYQTFLDEDGRSSGRALICSSDGVEMPARLDPDVIDSSAAAFVSTNRPIVIVISTGPRGGTSAEMAWPLEVFLDTCADISMKTKPKDIGRALEVAEEDETLSFEGVVIRARHHRDKNERQMMTLTILSEVGAAKILVFSGRMKADVMGLETGDRISFRAKALGGGGACLSDHSISFL